MSTSENIGEFIKNNWPVLSFVIVLFIIIIVLSVVIGTSKNCATPDQIKKLNDDLKKLQMGKAAATAITAGCNNFLSS